MGAPPKFQVRAILAGSQAVADLLGTRAARKLARKVSRQIDEGDLSAVAISSENLVFNEILRELTSVLGNADLPLTPAPIDSIEQAVAFIL